MSPLVMPAQRPVRSALRNAMAAYWPLSEQSGVRADLVGGVLLTDNNTVTGGTGNYGPASLFTRANSEYLSGTVALIGTSFTINSWSKLTTNANQMYVAGKGTYGVTAVAQVYADVGVYRFLYSSDGAAVSQASGGTPDTTAFHMLTGRVDRRSSSDLRVTLWVDGVMVDTEYTATADLNSDASFMIGATSAGTVTLDGVAHDVTVWKRALTNGEIAQLYNKGKGMRFPFRGF